ncbi:MAG TPA: hypothetical protein VJS69_01195 [Candidatus Krumholzibacteria bacterium]|nr:hypothetical protein [Candidatus Krumholzibacteria bacterium]
MTVERIDGHFVIRIDPHNGSCRGAHDILIHIMRTPVAVEEVIGDEYYYSLSWNSSVFLSVEGSESFLRGLQAATALVRQLERDEAKGLDTVRELLKHRGGRL